MYTQFNTITSNTPNTLNEHIQHDSQSKLVKQVGYGINVVYSGCIEPR